MRGCLRHPGTCWYQVPQQSGRVGEHGSLSSYVSYPLSEGSLTGLTNFRETNFTSNPSVQEQIWECLQQGLHRKTRPNSEILLFLD